MAIQELDLEILYQSGKKNANADSLSRYPTSSGKDNEHDGSFGILAMLTPVDKSEGSHLISEQQRADPGLADLIAYLETGVLPTDHDRAQEITLIRNEFALKDQVLHHLEKDGTLRLVPPTNSRRQLFDEAHSGGFGGHLREAKTHSRLSFHYWWPHMRSVIAKWSHACLPCATRQPGRAFKPPLTPISVGGAFDRLGVDIIQFPRSKDGNRYAVVFVDYLTKWPEVFAVADQTAHTIAQLLVKQIISRHGVPAELLSDQGADFLSGLIKEVCRILGIKQLNTTAYHPQTDGLVERFNRTLTAMLSKVVEKNGKDWDTKLPYVLFAYRTSMQESTRESPFFLMYGRDPRLPTATALSWPMERSMVDLEEYGENLAANLSEAWKMAQEAIQQAQSKQKQYYDDGTRTVFKAGNRAFLYKPSARSGSAYKFARPYHGPYRILEVMSNNAKIRPVDKPQDEPILVALSRLRRCPEEIGDDFWPTRKSTTSVETSVQGIPDNDTPAPIAEEQTGIWAGRLRKCRNEDTTS